MKPFRLGAVSYLNTLPYLRALQQHVPQDEVEVITDHPASLASQLAAGKLDLGLVPVTVLDEHRDLSLKTRFGIGCQGAVGSVLLCSQVPLEAIQEVLLDYQSRTSAALLRLLAEEHWRRQWLFRQTAPGYEQHIAGSRAALIIGNRALQQHGSFAYTYDLGQAWYDWTGMPFVFAAWIGRHSLPASLIGRLEQAFDRVEACAADVVRQEQPQFPNVDVSQYLLQRIQYRLTDEHLAALKRFLARLPVAESVGPHRD